MIRSLFDELSSKENYDVEHLAFNFSPSFADLRSVSLRKIIEVFRVWVRMIRLRCRGPIDLLWFPTGGPQTVPILRDLALLPILSLFTRQTVVQFHAAGIADRSDLLAKTLAVIARHCVQAAVVMTPFNRRDPESLGIRQIAVFPHRLFDSNPHGEIKTRSGRAPHFLYVGYLYEQKGTPQLLDAFARLLRDGTNAQLTLVGGFVGQFTPECCRDQIATLGLTDHVHLLGELHGSEKHAQFQDADCFIFPSIAQYESFGLVLVEAMMWGLPILATDWRGNADVLGDPPGGIIFPALEPLPDRISEALAQFIASRHHWPEWGQQNRARFVERFRATSSPRFDEFIRQVIAPVS
jgi:glycosyltransferase involved in cell wall biosynthesis